MTRLRLSLVVCSLLWSAAASPAAAADLVLYASDASTIRGNWARASEPTAAGGQYLASTDNGWATPDVPLASPTDYFEIPFSASADTYRVWFRLRAGANSKYNDSVWVQYSDATSGGASVYAIGSGSGLLVNLENCSGCGVSGWGWQDGAYWLSQATTIQFATSGTHTIRVQTREDGVQIDQIVLSSATYRSSAPGSATNDATVLSKGSGSGGASTASSAPYGGAPVTLPGRVEAENFDTGGPGVSYADTTPGNSGGAYRNSDVDIEPSTEGGYDVGWIAAGEWLNYSVAVSTPGNYTAQLRVASPNGRGSLHIGFNGSSNVWTTVSIPPTGGWQNWTTVSVPVTLAAGDQVMTLLFDAPGFNVNYVDVVAAAGPPPPPPPPPNPGGGSTITVGPGGDLQAAINSAQPGDTILLAPGATYAGSFVLPVKSGSSYVTIRSAAPDSSLPSDGTRITPAYASQLPRIQGGFAGMPAFTTAIGAHHYRLQFLEIMSTYAANQLVELGDGSPLQNSLSLVAHDFIVDRCYLHGDPANGQKRGIALNSASTSIVNSYFSDIKSAVDDAQAIGSWNGPGPFTISNNYLEASGENIMFGGADPSIPYLVPSDITIRQNYITKQTSWRSQAWTIKNLIELKNAQRVTIDANLFENNWAAAQQGLAVVFTPRNQNGGAPWTVVQQIQFTNNVVRHVAAVFNILGTDYTSPSQATNSITIRNNLFYDVSGANWGGNGRVLQTSGSGLSNVTVDHNTVFTDGTSVVWADGDPVGGFTFTNNIVPDNQWAIMGTGAAAGTSTLNTYYPGATVAKNVFIGGNSGAYPANNYYPASASAVQFNGDYSLSSSSPYRSGATDGTMIGADVKTLLGMVPQQ